jgi:hypothetical protein
VVEARSVPHRPLAACAYADLSAKVVQLIETAVTQRGMPRGVHQFSGAIWRRAEPTEEPMLNGKTVAILVTEGFEQVEMTEPRKAL